MFYMAPRGPYVSAGGKRKTLVPLLRHSALLCRAFAVPGLPATVRRHAVLLRGHQGLADAKENTSLSAAFALTGSQKPVLLSSWCFKKEGRARLLKRQ